MNFLIAYVQIVMSKKSVQIVLSTKSIQIVRYALQKSVKVKCAVQKILSKFCSLDVISQPIYCPKTMQNTRKTANMVFFKGCQYQDLLKPAKYATKYKISVWKK